MSKLLGVILAGGLSRRMEGKEKALLSLGSKPLISHATDRLHEQLDQMIINANGDPARFAFLDTEIVADTVEGFAGPLAGVLAAMQWARTNTDCNFILTAAVDTPFFPANYADKMANATQLGSAKIALAQSSGRRHPVFGMWDVSLANELEEFLVREEGRKVMLFVERFPNVMVEFTTNSYDPFFNINTPDDIEAAETILMENSV